MSVYTKYSFGPYAARGPVFETSDLWPVFNLET